MSDPEPMRSSAELSQEENAAEIAAAGVTEAAETLAHEQEIDDLLAEREDAHNETNNQTPKLAPLADPLRELVAELEAAAKEFPDIAQRCVLASAYIGHAITVLEAD